MVKAIHLGEITLDKSWSSRLGVCREASSFTQEKLLAKKNAQRGNAGQMILGRSGHIQRMKNELLDIGTWNVKVLEDIKEHKHTQLEESSTE